MPSTNLPQLLKSYENALTVLQDAQPLPTAKEVLTVLKVRDSIQVLVADKTKDEPEGLLSLIQLDEQLIRQTQRVEQAIKLADWRSSLIPDDKAWWWFLDKQAAERQQRSHFLLEIIAVTFIVLAIPLAVEIIKRFLSGAPDTISIMGTLLILFLTASPFNKQGRKVVQWLFERLPFIKLKYRAGVMVATSGVVFVILLAALLWIIPGPLATYYNNIGVADQANGNLMLAQRMFQRAAALNPDRVVPYYNLARAYHDAGLEGKASEWYQKAIESDANFSPAYRALGELYNQQGEYIAAEKVLLGGLSVHLDSTGQVIQDVTQYELLANLGWSHWGQGKIELARATLVSALEMESELKTLGETNGVEYRLALPHFYLAQVYEEAGDTALAIQQWEDALRFLDQAEWRQRERYEFALRHLQSLTGK